MSVPSLFPPEFLSAIAQLRLAGRLLPRDPHRGEHVSRQAGVGLDFRDFRAYAPGDDFRRIDWNVYQRTRRLVTRVYDTPRQVPVTVLLDVSGSMFFDAPPRADAARQVTAAVARAGLAAHNPVRVFPFDQRLMAPLRCPTANAFPQLLQQLAQLEAGDHTDLPTILRDLSRQRLRRGLLVVVTDFFQPQGPAAALEALARFDQQFILVQVTHADDELTATDDEAELVDCESGERLRLRIDEKVVARYTAARTAFAETLRTFAARHGAFVLEVNACQPVLPQLAPLMSTGMIRHG
jgi:uncharacterized protein (DUF58 family)